MLTFPDFFFDNREPRPVDWPAGNAHTAPLGFNPSDHLLAGAVHRSVAAVPDNPNLVVRWLPWSDTPETAARPVKEWRRDIKTMSRHLDALREAGIYVPKTRPLLVRGPSPGAPVTYMAVVDRAEITPLNPSNPEHEPYALHIAASALAYARWSLFSREAKRQFLWDISRADQWGIGRPAADPKAPLRATYVDTEPHLADERDKMMFGVRHIRLGDNLLKLLGALRPSPERQELETQVHELGLAADRINLNLFSGLARSRYRRRSEEQHAPTLQEVAARYRQNGRER